MLNTKRSFVTVVVVVVCAAQTAQSRGMSLLDIVRARAEALNINNGVNATNITSLHETTTTTTHEPGPLKTSAPIETTSTNTLASSAVTAAVTIAMPRKMAAPGQANICETLCPRWCRIGSLEEGLLDCHYECLRLCDKGATVSNPYIGNVDYEVLASQFNFEHYDINKDKRISVEEFMQTEIIPVVEIMDVFKFADVNNICVEKLRVKSTVDPKMAALSDDRRGDGYIDVDEFTGGPLVFTVQMSSELNQLTRADDQTGPVPN